MKRTYYREINGHNFSRFLEGDEAIYFVDNVKVRREIFKYAVIQAITQEMDTV